MNAPMSRRRIVTLGSTFLRDGIGELDHRHGVERTLVVLGDDPEVVQAYPVLHAVLVLQRDQHRLGVVADAVAHDHAQLTQGARGGRDGGGQYRVLGDTGGDDDQGVVLPAVQVEVVGDAADDVRPV